MLWTTAVSIEYLFDLKGVSVFSQFYAKYGQYVRVFTLETRMQ